MKKKLLVLFSFTALSGCAFSSFYEENALPFYEIDYALPVQAREWAEYAPLKDLCMATKNWRHEHIREAALNEIKARDINTKECYYTGMELTP